MIPMLPPAYFGPITYFGHLVPAGGVGLRSCDRFQKQTIRNRSEILGANGKIRLTVPLIKWSTKVSINEIRIDNSSNWKHVHWMSIQSAYRNSAFFDHYENQINSFFKEEFDFLVDLNVASIRLAVTLLKTDLDIQLIEESNDLNSESFIDLTAEFVKKRPTLPLPKYTQVFSDRFDFVSDLSVLDLVFNLGPRALFYLQNLHKNH